MHHHLSNPEKAIECYQHALNLNRQLGAHYAEADILTRLGDTQYATGHTDHARHTWRQALAILNDLDHPDAEQVKANLGMPLDRQSDRRIG